MLKDLSGAVHLTQDDNHLIIDVLFKRSQVTARVLLQLCADLTQQRHSVNAWGANLGLLAKQHSM